MLPWMVETDGKVVHCSQVGILARPNGQISLLKFCECSSFDHLQRSFINCAFKDEYRILFHPDTVSNQFASKLFSLPITGSCLIYIPDTDLSKEDVDRLVEKFKKD